MSGTSGQRPTASEALASGRYAFADLGCGSGGSLLHATHRFGRVPGLGLELDQSLVDEAVRNGLDVLQADLLSVDAPAGCIEFTTMMDFLEHLPDEQSARSVLEIFGRASRDFLFIRHPSFENRRYLAERGLKVDWTHWTGHPNTMTVGDFARVFESLGWTDYAIFPRHRISDSTHSRVIPLDAPIDVVTYDARKHGPKPFVRFDRPLYTQFDIFVRLNPRLDDVSWEAILATDRLDDEMKARETAGFYTAADSQWHVRPANTGGDALAGARFGGASRGYHPVVGDWDGDGVDGLGLYDPATGAFFLRDRLGEGPSDVSFVFGGAGAIPIAGDWTGTGVDTVGLYRPDTGQWFLRHEHTSGPADTVFSFGPVGAGLLPVAGDWDGDGVDSVGLYDPKTSSWYLRDTNTTGSADRAFVFGFPGSVPVAGDWDGDGIDTVGVFEPDSGEWHLRNSHTGGTPNVLFAFSVDGGIPVVGRWGVDY